MTTGSATASRRDFRIAVVDDHALFSDALELTLGIEGYDVRSVPLPEAGLALPELLARILGQEPRLVLLDLDLGPSGDGVELVTPLAAAGSTSSCSPLPSTVAAGVRRSGPVPARC